MISASSSKRSTCTRSSSCRPVRLTTSAGPTERQKRQEQPQTLTALTTSSFCLRTPIHANAHHSAVCPPCLHVTLFTDSVFPAFANALALAWPRTASEAIRTHHPRVSQRQQSLITGSGLNCDAGSRGSQPTLHILFLQSQCGLIRAPFSETDRALHSPSFSRLSTFASRLEFRTSLTTFAQL